MSFNRDHDGVGDFCPSCNQYGCHLSTCTMYGVQAALRPYRELYEQARSDYECMRIENFSLSNELRTLKQKHTEELARLLKRLSLMEDLVTKQDFDKPHLNTPILRNKPNA
jgi:hypothetical protein